MATLEPMWSTVDNRSDDRRRSVAGRVGDAADLILDAATEGAGVRRLFFRGSVEAIAAAQDSVATEAVRRGLVPAEAGLLVEQPSLLSSFGDRSVVLVARTAAGRDRGTQRQLLATCLSLCAVALVRVRVVVAPDLGVATGAVVEAGGESDVLSGAPYAADSKAAATARLNLVADRCATSFGCGGRGALAERRLRAALGRAARRQNHEHALEAGCRLAQLLVARQRPRAALRTLASLAAALAASREVSVATHAAVLSGQSLVELARLADAERVLSCAELAARLAAPDLVVSAALRLAECLYWQARFGDARILVDACSSSGAARSVEALRRCWVVRLALAAGDVGRAVRVAHELSRSAHAVDDGTLATICLEMARVHGFAGNFDEADRQVRLGLSAARRIGDVRLSRELRLVRAETLVRSHRPSDRRTATRWLERQRTRGSTPLMRSRIERLMLDAGARMNARRGPLMVASGIARSGDGVLDRGAAAVVKELVEVLELFHEADDDTVVLERMCQLVRERLSAAAVSVLGEDGEVLAASGRRSRTPPATAARARATGQLVLPCLCDGGLEASAPVLYGGATLGVICCRWPPDGSPEWPRASGLLSTAATASAPIVRSVVDQRRAALEALPEDAGIVGASEAMARVRAQVRRAAAAPFHVLIEGESGSGKELVARAVHRLSPRGHRRFAPVNCASLPDDLLEAELFGHTRGAFTGALAERIGLFEEADGGTLFLDEVGELSLRAQAKLLRVLQEGEVRRVGENVPRRIDARIVAATNRSLACEVEAGRFRADLRYRLQVVHILVPPLRERREDIAPLALGFWQQSAARVGSRATMAPELMSSLARYDWPGNVRELQNVVATLLVHAPSRGRVGGAALPEAIRAASSSAPPATLDAARKRFESVFVRDALVRSGWRRTDAARELGLSRQGLVKVMARLGIDRVGFTDQPDGA